ncbi:hypothetical protein H6F86_30625 [Phormidium sp. FACHB-592]|uniref:Uncharacterized protein n=1 Tax=Stenomitos frigidus AS-A4 TaxID=2933935 RepID=A0ABV0KGL9_9CYAN|nr:MULTISPECIES: hypothetical protein [Cyanophyceae]MBD2035814.1 hypothetical protein [Leptolyngbya sp. FACHB-321]MBD2078168.1 hypothetical protein [Phormidium sp. FACHB-592]
MTQLELTQCLHLAKTLDLIVSSRMINGVLYVYDAAGQKKPWDSFVSDYPLERLRAMIDRRQIRPTTAT